MRILLNSDELNLLPKETIYFHIGDNNEEKNIIDYEKNHIDNARYISFDDDLVGEIKKHGGRHPLPNMEDFAEKIMDFGVSKDTPVLVYGRNSFTNAARMWWMLKSIGVKNVHILYGSLYSYMYENNPTESGIVDFEKNNIRDLKYNKDKTMDYDEVKNIVYDDDYILIDSRDTNRYEGVLDPVDNHPGHIPNSINKYFEELLLGNNPPSINEIKNFFDDVDKDKKIVLYCGSGVTAGVNAIYLSEIGVEPIIYSGSYSDWVTYPGSIIELGKSFG